MTELVAKVVLPSIIDRAVVKLSGWSTRILSKTSVDDELSIVETTNPAKPVTLRFGYVGNIQYHPLSRRQIDELMTVLSAHSTQKWKAE